MRTPQIVVYLLTFVAVILLWTLGSPGPLPIKILQTFAIIIVGYMLAAFTTIEKAK
jgi:hypothetical protein